MENKIVTKAELKEIWADFYLELNGFLFPVSKTNLKKLPPKSLFELQKIEGKKWTSYIVKKIS